MRQHLVVLGMCCLPGFPVFVFLHLAMLLIGNPGAQPPKIAPLVYKVKLKDVEKIHFCDCSILFL